MLVTACCILSKFYIKPQPDVCASFYDEVVSYRNSTSNHNFAADPTAIAQLYLIEILHQTTTDQAAAKHNLALYLIEILHQTTTTCFTTQFVPLLYLIEILHQTTTFCESS